MKTLMFILLVTLSSATIGAQYRGGSNYNFYTLNGCFREDFGVLKNYHLASDIIEYDLNSMYSNGQRRLRVGVFHGNGISSGTVIDSSSGRLPGQYVLNLKNLINLAKQQGFVEVVVALHTLGIYDPTSWAKTQNFDAQISGALEENWGVIQSIMPVIESANIRVLIDLGNEA